MEGVPSKDVFLLPYLHKIKKRGSERGFFLIREVMEDANESSNKNKKKKKKIKEVIYQL